MKNDNDCDIIILGDVMIMNDDQKMINQEDSILKYDKKEIDLDVLDYLRKHTKLKLIETYRIAKARKIGSRYREIYGLANYFEVYSKFADELEFKFRISAWQHLLEKSWKIYGDEESLAEYSKRVLANQIEEYKNTKTKTNKLK